MQAVKLTCYDQQVNQGGPKPGCIQRSINNNLASPRLPVSVGLAGVGWHAAAAQRVDGLRG